MRNIFDYTREELEKFLLDHGFKKFMALQIFEWIYGKNVYDVSDFSNIKNENREFIKNNFSFEFIKIIKVEEDKDTKKFLFKLLDGNLIEAVLMYHDYGKSVCISSEVGCNMGCKFCESGRLKKVRDLSAFEMVEQIILIEQYIKEKINSVVIMGIGEPFDNYENIIRFIKIINNPKALAIGARHITVSTCGIIPKIKEFMKLDLQVNLAISLHAPTNSLREKIMPITKAYPLEKLIDTLKEYIKVTGRRLTVEYIMLDKINDNDEDAKNLANLLKDMNAYVNLIPYNETENIEFKASSKNRIDNFFNILKQNNIDVTVRRKFGTKISAACGQLRSKIGEESGLQ